MVHRIYGEIIPSLNPFVNHTYLGHEGLVMHEAIADPRFMQMWHRFAEWLILGDAGMLSLTQNFDQRLIMGTIGLMHWHRSPHQAVWTENRKHAFDCARHTEPSVRSSYFRDNVQEWSCKAAAHFALLASACSSSRLGDQAALTVYYAATAYGYAAQSSQGLAVAKAGDSPTERYNRFKEVHADAAQTACRRMYAKLSELVLKVTVDPITQTKAWRTPDSVWPRDGSVRVPLLFLPEESKDDWLSELRRTL